MNFSEEELVVIYSALKLAEAKAVYRRKFVRREKIRLIMEKIFKHLHPAFVDSLRETL